jgi:hypothetical protein
MLAIRASIRSKVEMEDGRTRFTRRSQMKESVRPRFAMLTSRVNPAKLDANVQRTYYDAKSATFFRILTSPFLRHRSSREDFTRSPPDVPVADAGSAAGKYTFLHSVVDVPRQHSV